MTANQIRPRLVTQRTFPSSADAAAALARQSIPDTLMPSLYAHSAPTTLKGKPYFSVRTEPSANAHGLALGWGPPWIGSSPTDMPPVRLAAAMPLRAG